MSIPTQRDDMIAFNMLTGKPVTEGDLAQSGLTMEDFMSQGRAFQLMQCRLELGVIHVNRWGLTPAGMDILKDNLGKTQVDWKTLALESYVRQHQKPPPGLNDECLTILFDRAISAFKDTVMSGSFEIKVPNGCCNMRICPKSLFVSAMLSVMATK